MLRPATLALLFFASKLSAAQQPPRYEEWSSQFATSGAELSVKEVGRGKVERVTVVTYHFEARGLPTEKSYRFWLWELGQEPQGGLLANIGKDGAVFLQDGKEPSESGRPIEIKVFGVPAEPKRFAIVSADGQSKAFAEVIPFPIAAHDGNCALSVRMESPLYQLVTIQVEGLGSGEKFKVQFQSGREKGKLNPRADERGHWSAMIGPYVKGEQKGFTEVEIVGSSCHPKAVFPWGVHYYQ